jgi:hypothetical protein
VCSRVGHKILKLLDVMCVGACVHLKDKERESASAERERQDKHLVWAGGPVWKRLSKREKERVQRRAKRTERAEQDPSIRLGHAMRSSHLSHSLELSHLSLSIYLSLIISYCMLVSGV